MCNFAGNINVSDYGVTAPTHRRFHDIQHMHHINFLNSETFLLLRHICHHGFQIRDYRPSLEDAKKDELFQGETSQLRKVKVMIREASRKRLSCSELHNTTLENFKLILLYHHQRHLLLFLQPYFFVLKDLSCQTIFIHI